MENKLKRKFGLLMAMCMVVGTIIGSGIFFRNEEIVAYAGGRMWIGIAAWAIGGFITLAFAYVLGVLSTRHEKVGGLLDYSDVLVGEKFGYMFGWFMATFFYPSMTGILAWISARFTVELFGWHTTRGVNQFFSGETFAIALVYLVAIYVINTLSPKISEKIQISGTFIKIIPLIGMGIVGLIAGLANGVTLENLSYVVAETPVRGVMNIQIGYYPAGSAFLSALIATVFAYVGFDCVMNLNSEIKNAKRNLPIALTGGLLIITAIYVLYFVGIFGAAYTETLASGGTRTAFTNIFTETGGTILFVFIVISCLGTLNGLTVAGQRAFYAIAARRRGPKPEIFGQVDAATNMPNNSAALNLLLIAVWMFINGAQQAGWFSYLSFLLPESGNIEVFRFNIAALIPITFNAFFIPMFIMVMVKQKDLGIFNRFIAPGIATAGAIFLIYAVIQREEWVVAYYLALFAVVMCGGWLLHKRKEAKQVADVAESPE
ncbi:MAG: APC family permease [Oscillospiraceae bacterium]|nr:APC family permease [Oscillospiraceae bacterium]